MISKDQAAIASVQLINRYSSQRSNTEIIRRNSHNGRFIIPILTISLIISSGRTEPLQPWLLAMFALFVVLIGFLSIYQRRTPLLEFKANTLICYGATPWQKKVFQMADITNVKFTIPFQFWQSSRSLIIKTSQAEHRVGISDQQISNNSTRVLEIRKLFAEHFQDRYVEAMV